MKLQWNRTYFIIALSGLTALGWWAHGHWREKQIMKQEFRRFLSCRHAMEYYRHGFQMYQADNAGYFPRSLDQLIPYVGPMEPYEDVEPCTYFYIGDQVTPSIDSDYFPVIFDRVGNHHNKILTIYSNGEYRSWENENRYSNDLEMLNQLINVYSESEDLTSIFRNLRDTL